MTVFGSIKKHLFFSIQGACSGAQINVTKGNTGKPLNQLTRASITFC